MNTQVRTIPTRGAKFAQLCALAALGLLNACGQPQTQLPDMNLRSSCKAESVRGLEPEIEELMRTHGFKVLNMAAMRRTRAIQAPWPLEIEGLDDRDRHISAISHDISPGEQSLSLYSPPQTQRDSALEQALISFFEAKCGTLSVHRASNDASAAYVNQVHVKTLRQRMAEAKVP